MAEGPDIKTTQVKPDTATLCNELGSVSDWHTLGLNLGVKDHELDQIERSHPTEGCGRWKQETFSLWLRCKPSASWQDVAGALRQMGENTVAERIELKYNDTSPALFSGAFTPPSSFFSSGTPSSISTFSTYMSPKDQDMRKSRVFACENLGAIKGKFADFQTNVCEKFEQIGVDIRKFRQYVAIQFSPGKCIPSSPTSLMEIFEAITHHGLWNFFHYSPLVKIIEKFGAGDPEMKAWIKKYKRDLKSYKLVATLEDYIDSEIDYEIDSEDYSEPPPAKKAKYDPSYLTQMEWKTEFVDHSLQYLTDVWEMFSSHYLLPDSPPTALLDRVRKGCVSVTWLIPSKLVPQLVKMAKIDTHFFQKHRILKVKVGGQCVYEEETSEETTSNGSSNFEGEGGADHYNETSRIQNEDVPPEIPVYKHGYECKIIDPPAWAAALPTTCPICLQVLHNPQQTICGHTFCEICLKKAQASQKQTCPECKKTKVSTFPHESLRRLLNDLQVQCTIHNEEGVCDWTGELREVDNHLNLNPAKPDQLLTGCKFVSLQCEFSYAGCEAQMTRKHMAIHMKQEQSYHIQLLADKVKKQDVQLKEQTRQIEKLTAKLQRKEEETACTIQQMQKEFTLQLQNKDEKIAHLMQQKQDIKPTPKLHQVNFCFTLDKFKRRKKKNEEWYSEPFYTHPGGYRMCIRIDANGFDDNKFVSLFTCIMKGEYDDELSWPFHGKVTVELLNQRKDSHHHAYTITYNAESMGADYCDYAGRVLISEMNHGWGNSEFISLLELSEKSSSTQYLKGDCLKFRVCEVLLYN